MTSSFLARVVDAFESRPDNIAMRIVGDVEHIYTFGETLRRVRAVAYRLGQEGVGFGDRVALIGENHPSWAIAYLGVLYCGAVCVPVDPEGAPATLANFIENSDAKLAFIGEEVSAKVAEIETRLGREVRKVVWGGRNVKSPAPLTADDADDADKSRYEPPSSDPLSSASSASSAVNKPRHQDSPSPELFHDWTSTPFPDSFAAEIPRAAGNDVALLIYTSGTTGTPKGVPLTHGNIAAELDGINDVLKFTDQEKILSLLPLFHAYLQIVNLWVATTYACEVGYLKELSPAELSSAMKEFKPTILTTVPRLWYLFHKKIFDAVAAKPSAVRTLFKGMLAANGALRNTAGVNIGQKLFGQIHEGFGGRLRIAISAGSRFDEDVAADFHKLGFTILQGYGLTETSGAATATYETDNRVGSVGKPLKGAEIKLDKPDKDGVGEVLIRGDMVFEGYYRNPSATAEAFTEDGWFRSGDLGRLDADGHLYIVGRAKDVIVLPSGKNVHPEDLEIHYLKTPLVEELAVIGVRDETAQHAGAEKLAAIVVPDFEYLKQERVANSKEAIRYALDNLGRELPEYQRVRDYIIRAEPLPRTGSRKIKRFELKKEVELGTINGHEKERRVWEISAEDRLLLDTPSAQTVVSIIRSHAPEAEVIHPAMNLEIDLGLDSLARAETFAALEMAVGREFEGDDAAKALTVRDLIDLILSEPRRSGNAELGTRNAEYAPSDSLIPADNSYQNEANSAFRVPHSELTNWSSIIRSADEEIPELRKALENRPVFAVFAFSAYKCFNLFCRVFMRLEVRGMENLRSMKRPFLICPNHQSFLDPFVLCSNYPFD
ncbi:MAG TPA: AMP-binding protein, partial [Pyrinomonadaceae bacterium]|nr:AMP-binding protein [Pyrinomonadaceae bacterium]